MDEIGPRVVYFNENKDDVNLKKYYTSSCPIPAFLHASKTSRELALGRWKLSLATNDEPAKIFVDFSLDTLYFDESFGDLSEFTSAVNAGDLQRVTRVAFDLQWQLDREYYEDGRHMSMKLLTDFPNLTHLLIPAEDYDYDWLDALDGLPQREPHPDKTVVLFFDADADDVTWMQEDTEILWGLEEHRKAVNAEPINIVCVNYCRSFPDQVERKQHEIIQTKYRIRLSLDSEHYFGFR